MLDKKETTKEGFCVHMFLQCRKNWADIHIWINILEREPGEVRQIEKRNDEVLEN